MGHVPVKSLGVRMGGQRYVGNVAVGVCYRPPVRKEQMMPSDNRKKPPVHRPWCSQGNFSHHNICWRDNREGYK